MAQPAFLSALRHRQQHPPPPPLPHVQPRRGYHIELGAREKALLEEDTALKRFKSYKKGVKQVSRIGNSLTLLAAVGRLLFVLLTLSTTAACGHNPGSLGCSIKSCIADIYFSDKLRM